MNLLNHRFIEERAVLLRLTVTDIERINSAQRRTTAHPPRKQSELPVRISGLYCSHGMVCMGITPNYYDLRCRYNPLHAFRSRQEHAASVPALFSSPSDVALRLRQS
jgi:hypothetical protein